MTRAANRPMIVRGTPPTDLLRVSPMFEDEIGLSRQHLTLRPFLEWDPPLLKKTLTPSGARSRKRSATSTFL
jgi:hypothetical protein